MMTDDKVMAWLKDKEMHIKNRAENRGYTYGVTLNTSDLSYIHWLEHILRARKGLLIEKSPLEFTREGTVYYCPRCKAGYSKNESINYCCRCGQRIRWRV